MDHNAHEATNELAAVLASPAFRASPKLSSLLEYLFANQKPGALKETVIAIEFFGRDSDYDPKADSMVRTEIRRLRLKLADYYLNEGATAAGRLEIPKGAYEVAWRPCGAPKTTQELAPSQGPQQRLRLWIPVLTALLLAVGLAWKTNGPRNPPRSIAVLPFGVAAPGPTETIADDLAMRLSRSKQLRVTAANATVQFRNRSESVNAIGNRLGVEAVVDGSIQSEARGQVAVEARLTDVRSGRQLWARKAAGPSQDLSQIEDELSAGVLSALSLQALPPPYHPKTAAMDFYVLGLQEIRKPVHEVERALAQFERAGALDQGFAAPQVAIAEIYLVGANNGAMDPTVALPRAETALRKALGADPGSSEAHTAFGDLHYARHAWQEARSEYGTAMELNPSSAVAHTSLATLLIILGRFDEAEGELRRAMQLNPLWYAPQQTLAELYYYARRYDQSFEAAKAMDQRFPGEFGGLIMAKARRRQGHNAEAAQLMAGLPAGAGPVLRAIKAIYTGDRESAVAFRDSSDKRKDYLQAWLRATISMEMGDREQAIGWLEKSLTAGDPDLCSLSVEPLFDPIRDDPRCRRILSELHLPTSK